MGHLPEEAPDIGPDVEDCPLIDDLEILLISQCGILLELPSVA